MTALSPAPNAFTAAMQQADRATADHRWQDACFAWSEARDAAPDDALRAYAFDEYYAAYYRCRHHTDPTWPWGPIPPALQAISRTA